VVSANFAHWAKTQETGAQASVSHTARVPFGLALEKPKKGPVTVRNQAHRAYRGATGHIAYTERGAT
jgi:hypothetical protein